MPSEILFVFISENIPIRRYGILNYTHTQIVTVVSHHGNELKHKSSITCAVHDFPQKNPSC